jgi:glutaryl-CoA dehydrogenase (non-decarboxylating)
MLHEHLKKYSYLRAEVKAWVDENVVPFADQWDLAEAIPKNVIQDFAAQGFLGYPISKEWGGSGLDEAVWGVVTEEIGRGCSSLRSLLTVHSSITSQTIQRWGSDDQKGTWLPKLASGETIAAFGLSEKNAGSDAASLETSYEETADHFVLNGGKKWTTFGQIADVLLVFATHPDKGISAFLLDTQTPGVEMKPLKNIMGTRASMLAEFTFTDCKIPKETLLGKEGWGFMQIANTGLDNGRFSVACGSLGIAKACLEAAVTHANEREQFGVKIGQHQLIKQKIARMVVAVKNAQLSCANAAQLRVDKSPSAQTQTRIAKYIASEAAVFCSREALQICGALGMSGERSVQRLFRDAPVTTIIEGSSEIQEILLADEALKNLNSILEA